MKAYADGNTASVQRQPAAAEHQPGRASQGAWVSALQQSPRMLAQRQALHNSFGPVLQRKAAGLEDELPAQARAAGIPAGGAVQAQAEPLPNQTGMPDQLKLGIESLSGMDMSEVRVHSNSNKPAQLNALAYAQGNDIHLGPGQVQHLPHEAWHVVQQRQGRVQATMQMAGVGVNDDVGLEREADVMGDKAAGAVVSHPVTGSRNFQAAAPSGHVQRVGVVQRMVVATAPVAGIDRVIAADVAFQDSRAGGSTLSLNEIAQNKAGTYSIADGEWIIICGHGDTSAIDGVTPSSLSAHLKMVGNHEKVGGVYLSACNTATIDSKGLSFLQQFQADFTSGGKGPEPYIVGATGYKINDFDSVSGEQQVAVPTAKGGEAGELQSTHWEQSGMVGAIDKPIGASSMADVLKQGQALLQNQQFRQFFNSFVGDLKESKLLEPDQLIDQKGRSINLH